MSVTNEAAPPTDPTEVAEIQHLFTMLVERAPREAVAMLEPYPPEFVVTMLQLLNPALRQSVLKCMSSARRQSVLACASPEERQQWTRNEAYGENTIGHMMEPPLAVFRPDTTIAVATQALRYFVKRAFITYIFVTDDDEKLLGVVVMREMLLGNPQERLEEIMIPNPFALSPYMSLTEAMKAVLIKHFPVYPVCDPEGRLVGLMRGQMLFEAQAIELSAQAGTMVGVEKEERLSTSWPRSLISRHPWLQLNLLTAFVSAGVVGFFQDTIDRILILAVFLPVLAGQAQNTGSQALAVALRGMTLGELRKGQESLLMAKEALLGLLNGVLVGATAGIGMFVFARLQNNPAAMELGFIVMAAMSASCLVSGVAGALVPIALKRLGADPATASVIFLSTATDVASMGIFLFLADWLI